MFLRSPLLDPVLLPTATDEPLFLINSLFNYSVPVMESRHENATDEPNVIQAAYGLRFAYYFIGSFGLLSNLFVIAVVLYYSPMRKHVTNIYIVNQSSIDATVACFLILTTRFEDDRSLLVPGYGPHEALCRLWYTKMPLWSMMVSSTYGIVALTLERFLAVVYPFWHRTTFTRSKMAITMTATWIIGPAYNIAYMTPSAEVLPDGKCTVYSQWPNHLTQQTVGIFTIFVQFILPLTALIYGYARMAYVLHQLVVDASSDAPVAGGMETRRNENVTRARTNVVKTLATVAIFFVLCWGWNQAYYLMFYLGSDLVDFTSDFYNFTVIMVFLNCCVNPIIYCIRYRQFQRGVMWMFCRNRMQLLLLQGTQQDRQDTLSTDERQLVCQRTGLSSSRDRLQQLSQQQCNGVQLARVTALPVQY